MSPARRLLSELHCNIYQYMVYNREKYCSIVYKWRCTLVGMEFLVSNEIVGYFYSSGVRIVECETNTRFIKGFWAHQHWRVDMNQFITTYHLLQQTPMIHFQFISRQKSPIPDSIEMGGCLRASDVKPKLDQFLLRWLQHHDIAIPDTWYVDPIHKSIKPALKYKLRFIARGDPSSGMPHKLYFGNQGVGKQDGPDHYIYSVFYNDPIEMKLTCFCKDTVDAAGLSLIKNVARASEKQVSLSQLLSAVLPSFFRLNAFGTRSGKGFGCFQLRKQETDFSVTFNEFCPIYYEIRYPSPPEHTVVLNDIWLISSMMKGGLNFTLERRKDAHGKYVYIDHPRDYYKGFIFRYFQSSDRNIANEKAYIKRFVLPGTAPDALRDMNPQSEENDKHPPKDIRFVRAMLGLPGNYEYRKTFDDYPPDKPKKTTRSGRVTVAHAVKDKDRKPIIQRFASPVLYRPEGNTLFIIPETIHQDMFGAPFEMRDNKHILRTPSTTEFNLIHFLDAFANEFNDPTCRKTLKSFDLKDVANATVCKELSFIMKKVGGKAGESDA